MTSIVEMATVGYIVDTLANDDTRVALVADSIVDIVNGIVVFISSCGIAIDFV